MRLHVSDEMICVCVYEQSQVCVQVNVWVCVSHKSVCARVTYWHINGRSGRGGVEVL